MKKMPSASMEISRILMVQLARLGDLLQSLPALSSLQETFPNSRFDLLCPFPLISLGKMFPGIQEVIPWKGEDWYQFAKKSECILQDTFPQVIEYLSNFPSIPYSLAYNLNNHPRSVLAAHLLSERVIGAGEQGALCRKSPPWVAYLQQVAHERGTNRIHLADAFCGVCGVKPPSVIPSIQATDVVLPFGLEKIVNDSSLVKIGIVVGAGDADRRVPHVVWRNVIEGCIQHIPNSLCVLIGGAGEREVALALEDQLPASCRSRLFDCVGKTTLPQLVYLFNRCQWVVGSDTGPMHLAVACGARAIGWYFSRARVHETGPYGEGHFVWQHQGNAHSGHSVHTQWKERAELPCSWPVQETVDLIYEQGHVPPLSDWELWTSYQDDLGLYYLPNDQLHEPELQRKNIWDQLSPWSSNHRSDSRLPALQTGNLI